MFHWPQWLKPQNTWGNFMRTTVIIFLFILISCSSKNELNSYLNRIDIKLNDKYEMLTNESSSAIGDYVANFKFRVSDNDFEHIIQIIKNTKGFQTIQKNNVFVDSTIGPNPKIKKSAWLKDGVYAYEITFQDTIGTGFESFLMYIGKDKVIDFSYANE